MNELVRYEVDAVDDRIGWITIDDGKVNVATPAMLDALGAALDQAARDDVVIVLSGRPGCFSAGFDLALFQDPEAGPAMLLQGFELARRVVAYDRPVLAAVTGHAIAMGLFLVCTADLRVAVAGNARFVANEVEIGLTLPHTPAELLRPRLTPSAFLAATTTAMPFDPGTAVAAGIVDAVASPEDFDAEIRATASRLASLDDTAQRATKRRLRAPWISALDAALQADRAALRERARA